MEMGLDHLIPKIFLDRDNDDITDGVNLIDKSIIRGSGKTNSEGAAERGDSYQKVCRELCHLKEEIDRGTEPCFFRTILEVQAEMVPKDPCVHWRHPVSSSSEEVSANELLLSLPSYYCL
mgnify:CR=1 FL=1